MTNYTGIGAIIDAIANTPILGYTAAYGTSLRDGVVSAILPYRFISHRGGAIQSGSYDRSTFIGDAYVTTWRIPDIMLLQAINANTGINSIDFDVFNYMGEYVAAIRNVVGQHYTVVDVSGDSSIVEWPDGSNQYYDAIVFITTVVENN